MLKANPIFKANPVSTALVLSWMSSVDLKNHEIKGSNPQFVKDFFESGQRECMNLQAKVPSQTRGLCRVKMPVHLVGYQKGKATVKLVPRDDFKGFYDVFLSLFSQLLFATIKLNEPLKNI